MRHISSAIPTLPCCPSTLHSLPQEERAQHLLMRFHIDSLEHSCCLLVKRAGHGASSGCGCKSSPLHGMQAVVRADKGEETTAFLRISDGSRSFQRGDCVRVQNANPKKAATVGRILHFYVQRVSQEPIPLSLLDDCALHGLNEVCMCHTAAAR